MFTHSIPTVYYLDLPSRGNSFLVLCDLQQLIHVAGCEPYNLHHLGQVSNVESVLVAGPAAQVPRVGSVLVVGPAQPTSQTCRLRSRLFSSYLICLDMCDLSDLS